MYKIEIQDLLCSTVNYTVLEKNLKEYIYTHIYTYIKIYRDIYIHI